jgi:hypothetical protein
VAPPPPHTALSLPETQRRFESQQPFTQVAAVQFPWPPPLPPLEPPDSGTAVPVSRGPASTGVSDPVLPSESPEPGVRRSLGAAPLQDPRMAIATAPEPPLSHISARRLAFIERFYLVATGRLLVLRIRRCRCSEHR